MTNRKTFGDTLPAMRVFKALALGLLAVLVLYGLIWASLSHLLLREVTLPNGMILRQVVDTGLSRRDDLFAVDGRTTLARDVDFVCFNDRYVDVSSNKAGVSGLYDGKTGMKVPVDDEVATLLASGLYAPGLGCDGYFTAMIGPDLLYVGGKAPHLPGCEYRNLQNKTLLQREWFDRPCTPKDWPVGG